MHVLMWTPPDADPILQVVEMDTREPLTQQAYLSKLDQKITLIAQAADPEDVDRLADYLAARGAERAEAVDAMVEQLRDTSILTAGPIPKGMTFPVPLEQIKLEPMELPGLAESLGQLEGTGS